MLRKTRNNPALTLTILNKLFEELPQQVAAIKKALTNNQYTVAEAVTHKLHGSVSLCGFTDMAKSADALENCLIKKDYQAMNSHFLLLQKRILNFTHNESVILTLLKNVPDQNTKSP
jgi:HPt (histidine-containing phosphotransfer) domain-containing protein